MNKFVINERKQTATKYASIRNVHYILYELVDSHDPSVDSTISFRSHLIPPQPLKQLKVTSIYMNIIYLIKANVSHGTRQHRNGR